MRLFAGLPIPELLDADRHAVVMRLSRFDPLHRVRAANPGTVASKMMHFLRSMYDMGYVHGDFNEFNVMVRGDDILVLDFPQCVPRDDPRAAAYFKRDVECVHRYFWKKHFHVCDHSVLSGAIEFFNIEISVERKRLQGHGTEAPGEDAAHIPQIL